MMEIAKQPMTLFELMPELLIRILSYLSVPDMMEFGATCSFARQLIYETPLLHRRIIFTILPWAFSGRLGSERGSPRTLRKIVGPYRSMKLDCPGEVNLSIITCLAKRLASGLRTLHYYGNRIWYIP